MELQMQKEDGHKKSAIVRGYTRRRAFGVFFQMMALGLQYYPLFVCVEYGRRNLYAPLTGFLYAILLTFLSCFLYWVCQMYLVLLFARNFLMAISTILHKKYGTLRCWRTLGNVMRLESDMDRDIQMFTSRRNRLYVKILLSSKENSQNGNKTESLRTKILTLLAKQKSCIHTEIVQRTSNRIASIFVISIILLYQWLVFWFNVTTIVQDSADSIKTYLKDVPFLMNNYKKILRFLDALVGSYYTATFAAGIILIANMYKIYSSHRRHISRLMAGNNTFIPTKCWDMKPSVILLEVKETTETNNSASYLDIMLSYDTDGHMNTSLYDKRDDFNFSITNFPFLSSNIPSSPAYGVFISQLIRYARASTKYTDFVLRARRLSDKLLSQGYVCDRLTSSLRKFYGRYGELVIHYDVPLSRMVDDILS
ncbi:hypothetical protein FSP39_025078 [Pinctada imbricata]|uniref:Uncharacterized protein n=1 Tax=Pinctada imbricata TaxID=66713 RepID=A0AA89BTM3_PINIB|nr:hypothetical protein FSP39_025078 [Pinctada imbricata]